MEPPSGHTASSRTSGPAIRWQAEYKAPGGKLVVVDFHLQDDVVRNFQVAGDFFLYPDDALDRIRQAVEGTPAGFSIAERAAAVSAALHAGDELIGVTCEAVAIAVQRALAGTP